MTAIACWFAIFSCRHVKGPCPGQFSADTNRNISYSAIYDCPSTPPASKGKDRSFNAQDLSLIDNHESHALATLVRLSVCDSIWHWSSLSSLLCLLKSLLPKRGPERAFIFYSPTNRSLQKVVLTSAQSRGLNTAQRHGCRRNLSFGPLLGPLSTPCHRAIEGLLSFKVDVVSLRQADASHKEGADLLDLSVLARHAPLTEE